MARDPAARVGVGERMTPGGRGGSRTLHRSGTPSRVHLGIRGAQQPNGFIAALLIGTALR